MGTIRPRIHLEMERASASLLPYLAVVGMLLAAILLRDGVKPDRPPPEALARYLEHELQERALGVVRWERQRRVFIEELADRSELRHAVRAALAGDRAPLRAALSRACARLDGCTLADVDGGLLASHGRPALPDALVRRAADGRTVHSAIVPSEVEEGLAGRVQHAVFFATPVLDEGRVQAVFVARIRPEAELGSILRREPLGRTVETYAVDSQGYMVTSSRFDAKRHRASSALQILPSQPSPHIASGPSPRAGSDVSGYLDYRGVPVVGAWQWMEELGAALVTEMDVSETTHLVALR